MRILLKTGVLTGFILLLSGQVSVASDPNTTLLSSHELVDRYTEALDSTANLVNHYEITGEYGGHFPNDHPFYSIYGGKNFRYKGFRRGVYKFKENEGDYHHEYAWGYFNEDWKKVPEDKPVFRVWINTVDISYFHQVNHHLHQPGRATWRKRTRQRAIAPITCSVGLSHLLGYIDSDERLDVLLRKADRISVREKTETIGGSECFVILAHTEYGHYAVWLDPQHGYHPAKVRHKAKAGERTHSHTIPAGSIATGYLDVLQFKKIDDIWIPVEARAGFHRTIGAPAFYMDEDNHYKRTEIILNPDHSKLGSFADPLFEDPENDPELVDGTIVEIMDGSDGTSKYTWQSGKLIPDEGK